MPSIAVLFGAKATDDNVSVAATAVRNDDGSNNDMATMISVAMIVIPMAIPVGHKITALMKSAITVGMAMVTVTTKATIMGMATSMLMKMWGKFLHMLRTGMNIGWSL